jgi:hypothetical protein
MMVSDPEDAVWYDHSTGDE